MFTIRKWWLLAIAALLPLSAHADGLLQNRFLASGAGTSINNIGTAIGFHKITWNVSGTASVCTVALDTSADGITWSAGAAIAGQTCTSNGSSTVATVVANYVRINMTALTVTAGSSVSVTWTGYVNNPAGGGGGSVTGCTTAGGVAFENGTNNTLTCGSALTWLPGVGNPSGIFVDNTATVTGSNPIAAATFLGEETINSPNTSSATVIGVIGQAAGHGSGTFSSNIDGISGNASYDGTGTVAELAGNALEGNANTGGGTVTLSAGFDCGDQHGVSATLNACFYAPDQGNGANDYAMYLVGGKVHTGGSMDAAGGIGSCTPPAVNGVYQYIYNVTASAAVPPTCPLVGLVARDVTGTTDTIITADANGLVAYTGSAAVATALPTPTTLLNANFFTVLLNNTTANVVVTPTTWAISINGATAGAGGAAVTIAPHVRCAVSVDRTLATTWDFDCVSVQGFESAGALGTGTTLIGGQDASANAVIGAMTVRGGDETGTGGATSQGGNTIVRGGNDAATNAASAAGMVELVPGLATGATQGLQGLLLIAENYIKGGGTSTLWNLQCIVTTTAMTVNDCGASPTVPVVGVAFAVNSNTVQVHSIGSQTPVNASAAVTVGHTVCAGSTAGKVTDSGTTAPCGSGAGFTVGEVIAVSGTYNFPIAGSVTLSTTLPLIQLNRVQGVGVGGISGVLAVANGGTGTGSTLTGVVRGGSPLTATELSGDATTSGSNAVSLAAPFKKRACEIVIGGTGASNVLQSGDDTIANNSCFNKIGVTETITAVYCKADVASNTVTINPTFGTAGTGTTILSGALTCGSSEAYSATGTVSNGALTDGSGIDVVMGGTLNAHDIHVLIIYTVPNA